MGGREIGSVECTDEEIERVADVLCNASESIGERYRAVFTLMNIGTDAAVLGLVRGLRSPGSALLRHEIAYVLGQMRNGRAEEALIEVLKDETDDKMVRHEAGEALGAIGLSTSLPALRLLEHDPAPEVAETCQLAVARIEWAQRKGAAVEADRCASPYGTTDPSPPSRKRDVPALRDRLLDGSLPLFKRYRAMFALRELSTEEAVLALCDGLDDPSALFRHEVAYVLGQIQHPAAVQALRASLEKHAEHPMVRHEAAEALGAIATPDSTTALKGHASDAVDVVRESCEVALEYLDYYASDTFQYADTLQKIRSLEAKIE